MLRQPGAPEEYYLFPGFVDSYSSTKMGGEVIPSVLKGGRGQQPIRCTLLRKRRLKP